MFLKVFPDQVFSSCFTKSISTSGFLIMFYKKYFQFRFSRHVLQKVFPGQVFSWCFTKIITTSGFLIMFYKKVQTEDTGVHVV